MKKRLEIIAWSKKRILLNVYNKQIIRFVHKQNYEFSEK